MAIKDDRPDNLGDDEPRRVILHDTKVFEREDETTSMDRTPRRSPRMASRESSRVSQGLSEDDPAVPGSRAYLAKKAREAAARLAEQPEQREREARQREAENIAHQDQEDVQ